MKITIEIGDELLKDAKAYANARDLTLKSTVEAGLRLLLEQSRSHQSFRLKDGSFRGDGMTADLSWPEIRSIIYEGRGA